MALRSWECCHNFHPWRFGMTKEDHDLLFPTEEMKRKMTLEGLADVAAGRLIPHGEVSRWLLSLGTDNPLPLPQVSQCKSE
jgi:hypothetical protein